MFFQTSNFQKTEKKEKKRKKKLYHMGNENVVECALSVLTGTAAPEFHRKKNYKFDPWPIKNWTFSLSLFFFFFFFFLFNIKKKFLQKFLNILGYISMVGPMHGLEIK